MASHLVADESSIIDITICLGAVASKVTSPTAESATSDRLSLLASLLLLSLIPLLIVLVRRVRRSNIDLSRWGLLSLDSAGEGCG